MKKFSLGLLALVCAGIIGCSGSTSETGDPGSSSTPTLFTVIDQTESYVKICFKSDLNSWTPVTMYDDGTHGDVTAGDHTWSLTFDVTGDGQWGAIEDDGSTNGLWLIASTMTTNPSFTRAADGTVSGTTSYTIPKPSTKANIVFTIVDSTGSLTNVKFKGSATSWALKQMYDDGTNGDATAGDHTWSVTLNVESGNWGAIEDDGSTWGIWLITGDNPAYTVADDGTVSGSTSYTYSTAK